MSISERTIKAFIQVIESRSTLLSIEDWSDLHELASKLPENIEEISTLIRDWLKVEQRHQIREAFENQRKNVPSTFYFSDRSLGIGNSQSQTPANQPSPSSKELLENAIKNNSPLSDQQKSQPTP